MKVLVTGASGFIGRALVSRLAATSGVELRAALRRPDNLAAAGSQAFAPDLSADANWRPALAGMDAVVHLAARVHVMSDQATDPLTEYRRINVAGTEGLARQAREAGVRRFLFVSSVKVNGEATVEGKPFRESDPPSPSDPYGVSKAEAEGTLFALAKSSGMEVVVVRPPLVYGPGVKANFLAMTRWLARGVPLPLGAINGNRRSLVGVDNLVDLIVNCLRHAAAANEVFLAGDGEDLSTTALLRRTAAAMGVRARLIPVPPVFLAAGAAVLGKRGVWQRLGGSLQVDISKARRVLGWNPPVTVDEGLRRAVRPVSPAS